MKKFLDTYHSLSGSYFEDHLNVFQRCGNTTGIYGDVAALLYYTLSLDGVDNVLEFGSGMSTCVLAHAADKYNKKLITIEPIEKWYSITKTAVENLELNTDFLFCSEINALPDIGCPDLVWVDGPVVKTDNQNEGRIKALDYYSDSIMGSLLLFDDAQSAKLNPLLTDWLYGQNRNSNIMFNPTGRGDRHVLISFTGCNSFEQEVKNFACH